MIDGGKTKSKKDNISDIWERPSHGELKLNTDVATKPDESIGIGYILRNYEGQVIFATYEEEVAQGDTTLLEVIAIRTTMEKMI